MAVSGMHCLEWARPRLSLVWLAARMLAMYCRGCAVEQAEARFQLRRKKLAMQLARSGRWRDSVRWLFLFSILGVFCQPRPASAANKVVTDADKGATVHLQTGDTLELRLRSNPSTGYMWYVQKESTPLLKLAHQSQTDATDPGAGRPVFQVFKFEPRRRGEGVLLMHYVRSWDPPTPEDEQFDLRVTIE
jgi:inhibitor of cysteine peptidase